MDVYYGHSAHVTKAKFSADDDLLISTGGGDMTVFVWDTDIINLNSQAVYEAHPDDIDNESKLDLSRQAKAEFKQKLLNE
jgi:WD40 repeat protein